MTCALIVNDVSIVKNANDQNRNKKQAGVYLRQQLVIHSPCTCVCAVAVNRSRIAIIERVRRIFASLSSAMKSELKSFYSLFTEIFLTHLITGNLLIHFFNLFKLFLTHISLNNYLI